MKSKKAAKKQLEIINTFNKFENDGPVHILVSFESFTKKAVYTPIKGSKITKK